MAKRFGRKQKRALKAQLISNEINIKNLNEKNDRLESEVRYAISSAIHKREDFNLMVRPAIPISRTSFKEGDISILEFSFSLKKILLGQMLSLEELKFIQSHPEPFVRDVVSKLKNELIKTLPEILKGITTTNQPH